MKLLICKLGKTHYTVCHHDVVHSRDEEEVGVAHGVKTSLNFPRRQWGSIGSVNPSFQVDPKSLQKVATFFR